MVRNTVSRLAFTMIELIFAIVIIAIAVLSLPMMVQITSRGIENNIVQEAIFASSAELIGATSGYWDERSMEDENVSHLSRVIDINTNCDGDRLRPGHIAQPFHRRCLDSNSNAGLNSTANATIFSLDDEEHTAVEDMFDNSIGEAAGYKQEYQSTLVVTPDGANANIKHIVSDVKDASGATLTILRMQSANVGEIDYYKRRF